MSEFIIPGVGPDHDRYQHLAALLEPDAIEYPRYGTFTYTVGPSETKYLLYAWSNYINPDSAARYEVRIPNWPLPLRGITLKGQQSGSTLVTLDPTLPQFSDARDAYFDRLEAISTLPTKWVGDASTGVNNHKLLLPGPYGSIMTSVNCFDFGWVALGAATAANTGYPIDYETGDSVSLPLRFGHTMMLPFSKNIVRSVYTGYPNNANAKGVVTYVDLPSTWSTIADPLAPYDFRDDFMGASLDTAVKWTRAQSTAGNVEIDTKFPWLKLKGNGAWGANGLYGKTGFARASQPVLLVDVNVTTPNYVVGWSNGAGHSYTNFAHCLDFSGGSIVVFENGTNRGTVGVGFAPGYTYRLRITALSGGGATYEIQGVNYAALGGPTWTNITPGTSSSATNTLYPGATINDSGTGSYLGDVRVY